MEAIFENLSGIVSTFNNYPRITLLLLIGLALFYLLKKILSDIKVEHLLQNTLNNRIKFVANQLDGGSLDKQRRSEMKLLHQQLINQKIFGVSNRFVQREVIDVIKSSREISSNKYFSRFQHILSIGEDGELFIDVKKVRVKII